MTEVQQGKNRYVIDTPEHETVFWVLSDRETNGRYEALIGRGRMKKP